MECEKCLCPWDTETHIPKILACGHTICQNCIYEISKKLLSQEEKLFKCPICNYEIMTITTKEDIMDLKKNLSLINLVDKVATNKSRANMSNISMSMSAHLNTSSFLVNDSSMNKEYDSNSINNNCFYPLCKIHQSKAYFYYFKNKEKKYVCLFCLENNVVDNSEKLIPLPSLDVQNELKIKACKKKSKLLIREIEKIQLFLERYHQKFESENKQKIEELFKYINKIVDYNHTTALTLYKQCKNEQKSQIEKKIKELVFLREELDSFNQKLVEIENEDLFKDKVNPDTQLQLEKIYNRLGNYINYENELSLFQMDININEEVKDSLFDLIQNAYRISIDFLKMKNGDLPNIRELLKKNTTWPCSCGQEDNDAKKIICSKCSRYRGLETYNNILFNPLIANKKEINDLAVRRRHEEQVFLSLRQRNLDAKKSDKNFKDTTFYVIDANWFNKWKAFVTNDLKDKILPNDMKYISDNKKIGVLPPDVIDNSKICTIINVKKSKNSNSNGDVSQYKLKKGLKAEKDYVIINQNIWEWLLINYSGGPEIKINAKVMNNATPLAPIKENEVNHNEKCIDENNINKNNILRNTKLSTNDISDNNCNIFKKMKVYANDKNENCGNNNIYNKGSLTNNNSKYNHNKAKESMDYKENENDNAEEKSSELEEKSKSISLDADASSNRINLVNTYIFNTKFCDFKNNKKSKKSQNNKCFEDVEFIINNNHNQMGRMISFFDFDKKNN
jgi:hypothetical protein